MENDLDLTRENAELRRRNRLLTLDLEQARKRCAELEADLSAPKKASAASKRKQQKDQP